MCKWADDNGGPDNNWRPIVKKKHPKAIAAKTAELTAKREAKIQKLKAHDPKRIYYSRVAAASERRTNIVLASAG
jgi:hypothetical protein